MYRFETVGLKKMCKLFSYDVALVSQDTAVVSQLKIAEIKAIQKETK